MVSRADSGSNRSRSLVLLAIAAAGLTLTAVVYFALRARESRLAEASFRLDAAQRSGTIDRQFAASLEMVRAVMAFYQGSQEVERSEFEAFTRLFFRNHPGIQAFLWAPLVRQTERAHHEQSARKDKLGDYRVVERSAGGGLEPASARRMEHFPVFFLAPPGNGAPGLGFDLASDPDCLRAIDRARSTGELAATRRLDLGDDPGASWSFLVFAPVYRKGPEAKTPAERFEQLVGIVAGVFQIGATVEESLNDSLRVGIDFELFDQTSSDREERLYSRPSPLRYKEFIAAGERAEQTPGGITHQVPLEVADRKWLIHSTPTDAYLALRASWLPPAMLICGLLMTALVMGFSGLLLGKTQLAEEVVVQRTAELQEANESLEREVVEHQHTERVLRDSESLYSSLVETLPVQVMRKDLEGRFTFANQSFCRLLGKPLEEIRGKTDYDFYPPELAEKYRRDDAQVAQRGELFECVEENQQDGQTYYVQVMKSPVRDARGTIVGTQVIFWDVTERIMAAAQTVKAKEAAESANRAKSQFLANMSHEIRTPLGAVLGLTELLLDTRLSSEQRQYLALVRESGEALLALVCDILDFSKIEAGKMELDCARFDLHEMLGDTLRALAVRAHHKHLELACRIRPSVPILVVGDATRLRQVVVNLVGNAIKFTDRGEVVVEVAVEEEEGLGIGEEKGLGIREEKGLGIRDWGLEGEGNEPRLDNGQACHGAPISNSQSPIFNPQSQISNSQSQISPQSLIPNPQPLTPNPQPLTPSITLRFSVTDTGIGIPEEKRQLIFGAFEQGDTTMTRRFGGSGLGLAISARLVGLMGGRVWLQSEVGCGSTFHFTAKLAAVPCEADESAAVPATAVHGLRVLVIDDNATCREILDEMLRSWDMRPLAAANANEALQRLRQAEREPQPIGAVLVDAGMPGVNGFDLVHRLRHEWGFSTPVIMLLTSGDRLAEISRCEELGVAACVLKPVKESELFDAIAIALGITTPGEEEVQIMEARARGQSRPLRVLLAEDSLVNQKLVTALLERQGHHVVTANNGKEAMAAVRDQAFDLIFMDVQMPEMDGLEATRLIRAAEKHSGTHVPIVAMTAHAMKGDRERCLEAGMDEYLPKPIRAKRVLDTIDALAGKPAESPPPVPSAVPETGLPEGCDWTVALDAVRGDRELLRLVAETFLEESPHLMCDLRQAVAEKDAIRLRRVAHTLKGSVNYFGGGPVFQSAYRLEQMGQDGDLAGAEDLLPALESQCQELASVLRHYTQGNGAEGRGGSP